MNKKLTSVHFINNQTGWSIKNDITIIHTLDGGETWEEQITIFRDILESVHFVDTQNGWVVGRYGTILHTYNGGKNWERQEIYLQ